MYKTNSGLIAKSKVSKYKKKPVFNRKFNAVNPLLLLY